MYSRKGRDGNFNSIAERQERISLPEVTMMLKDHGAYPRLISKDELAQLVRLVIMKTDGARASDLTMLSFQQFTVFIPQLAFLCFSRPPVDKSSFPPVACLQALIETFEQATRDRGKSTALYEDPDASTFADRELMRALEEKCAEDPTYPVPEGYRKVVERAPRLRFEVPECARQLLGEPRVVAVELLDEIVNAAIGTHFLEPLITFEERHRIKQAIRKTGPKNVSKGPSYMEKIEKIEESKRATPVAHLSAAEKRAAALEIKPKLSLALKLQVTKQDLKNRPHFQEVAEVFEEMLQACEKGLDRLPPRANRAPGQRTNQAKLQKEFEAAESKKEEARRERVRLERNDELKKQIKDSNYGGRGQPIGLYNMRK